MAIEQAPPLWTNQAIVLYHGTTIQAARQIAADGIHLRYGKPYRDFGPGFYTTTIMRQARRLAEKKAKLSRSAPGAVQLILDREEVAALQFLSFVDGQSTAEQFWSFVHYCRNGATDHARIVSANAASAYYDVVFGPVSSIWNRRQVIRAADQISFHSLEAQNLLNTKAERRMIPL